MKSLRLLVITLLTAQQAIGPTVAENKTITKGFNMEFFGFMMFLSVTYACDTYLFSKGFDTFWHKFKTKEEKQLRDNIINKA